MPNGQVRTARPEDLHPILELEASFPEGDRLTRRNRARLLKSESAECIVCETENGLLGAAILLFRKEQTRARLYSISVSEKARHQGVGRALLDASVTVAKKRDCTGLRLEVRHSNTAAISLYERAGFGVIGEKSSYYDDGEDALQMELSLNPDKPVYADE